MSKLMQSIDDRTRLAWEEVKAPPTITMLDSQHGGLVTAVTELEGKGMVMIMDVEKVLAEAAGFYRDDSTYQGIPSIG
jgi:two-component system chemotaxis response regulator CheV